jgi:energy-coupling factor transporter ATP-binding protein EcfA2
MPCTQVADGEFMWDAEQEKPTLKDISFEAKPGSLTMVVGAVGSGKSSVLAALISQIEKKAGTVFVGGKVAYVAQTAWITNDSVKVRGGCSALPAVPCDRCSLHCPLSCAAWQGSGKVLRMVPEDCSVHRCAHLLRGRA